jgi:hypothetical protein
MKSYEDINSRIESGKAVVLTAEEIIDYVDRKGLEAAAREVDVVTTATFGAMCSSGCFLNFGHSQPRMRITQAWIDGVPAYSGVAAVDAYLGATELAEICHLGTQEWGLKVVAVYDDTPKTTFLGLPVSPLAAIATDASEAIIVCVYDPALPMRERFLPPGLDRRPTMHWIFSPTDQVVPVPLPPAHAAAG